jgi:hypothetical protein
MWRNVLDEILREFLLKLAHFGPNLLAMAIVLLCGLSLALLLRLLVRETLPRLGFDRFSERTGLTAVLERGGVTRPPSTVAAAFALWTVVCVTVLLAIAALNIEVAMNLVARGFEYLPQLLIAAAIHAVGSLVSGFVRRSVLIAAVNADLASARLLAGGVHTALMILFTAMALEHLGVGRQILIASFTILFGGVVLALSLAFGLAGRDLARGFLERLRRRPERADPLQHL